MQCAHIDKVFRNLDKATDAGRKFQGGQSCIGVGDHPTSCAGDARHQVVKTADSDRRAGDEVGHRLRCGIDRARHTTRAAKRFRDVIDGLQQCRADQFLAFFDSDIQPVDLALVGVGCCRGLPCELRRQRGGNRVHVFRLDNVRVNTCAQFAERGCRSRKPLG